MLCFIDIGLTDILLSSLYLVATTGGAAFAPPPPVLPPGSIGIMPGYKKLI